MKAITFTFLLTVSFSFLLHGQSQVQYFDGADTMEWNSLFINIDTSSSNTWHIGPPQKTIFNAAATIPNVIVTDTTNFYPISDSSSFQFKINYEDFSWGILALQWKQKLDFDAGLDGGLLEFSPDNGANWQNAFNNPYVYNLYGFEDANADTLTDGTPVFTGTDTEWKDIWFCMDLSWLDSFNDTLLIRYKLQTDSIETNQEGWMIDNIIAHITILHTVDVKEAAQEEYLLVTPNPTTGRINIQARKTKGYHIIEGMELYNSAGQLIENYGIAPTKFFIDISPYPNGVYYLKVKTNLQTKTTKILLQK